MTISRLCASLHLCASASKSGPSQNYLRRLVALIAPFRWWMLLGVLLSAVTTGSSVGLMAVSAYLIAKAAVVTDMSELALIITGVRFFAISRAALRYAERYVTHLTTFRILTGLRVWFYQAIEPLAPARLWQVHSGDLLTRTVDDIETLENFYLRVATPPLAAALVTLFGCALLGWLDPWLGVALLVFLLLAGMALPLVSYWLSHTAASAVIDLRSALNTRLVDNVQGLADLLANGAAAEQQAAALALADRMEAAQRRLAWVRGLTNGLGALCTGLAGVTVLALAIPLVTAGQIDGVLLALLPLTAIACFEAVQPLAHSLQLLATSRAAAARLFTLIDAPPAVTDPPAPLAPPPLAPPLSAPALEVRGLTFRYHADEPPVLANLSFHAPGGGRVALVGPSGAGKTTLINLLVRFWEYEEGAILLDGHDLRRYAADDVRALVGVVAQQTHLFHATVRENLLLANPEADEAAVIAACRMAELHDFIAGLPQGYDTLVGENGVNLSGGERQRLAIARAVLKAAPILVLDEATAHLDDATAQRVLANLEPFMAGRTVLISAHRHIDLVRVDQVVALAQTM
jgi:ATP-binding cassette subfamily C protein CydC